MSKLVIYILEEWEGFWLCMDMKVGNMTFSLYSEDIVNEATLFVSMFMDVLNIAKYVSKRLDIEYTIDSSVLVLAKNTGEGTLKEINYLIEEN